MPDFPTLLIRPAVFDVSARGIRKLRAGFSAALGARESRGSKAFPPLPKISRHFPHLPKYAEFSLFLTGNTINELYFRSLFLRFDWVFSLPL